MNMDMKEKLDNLVKRYETSDFIPHDPVKFPHMFDNQQDQEVSGLIASSLAYGRRERILDDVEIIHRIMNYQPYNFALNFDMTKDAPKFEGFIHRYTSGRDVALLIYSIGKALREFETLESLFLQDYSSDDTNIKPALAFFVKELRDFLPENEANLRGLYHLIPDPDKGSACKRLNLYIKWMVRPGPVDLGIWKSVSTDKLIIPLDTHVAKLARKLNLTSRKVDDWKTAEEITENLKKYDPKDPVKYDFAIFGAGVSKESSLLFE